MEPHKEVKIDQQPSQSHETTQPQSEADFNSYHFPQASSALIEDQVQSALQMLVEEISKGYVHFQSLDELKALSSKSQAAEDLLAVAVENRQPGWEKITKILFYKDKLGSRAHDAVVDALNSDAGTAYAKRELKGHYVHEDYLRFPELAPLAAKIMGEHISLGKIIREDWDARLAVSRIGDYGVSARPLTLQIALACILGTEDFKNQALLGLKELDINPILKGALISSAWVVNTTLHIANIAVHGVGRSVGWLFNLLPVPDNRALEANKHATLGFMLGGPAGAALGHAVDVQEAKNRGD